ncbi:hypothetical protein [Cupriavidus sp. TMH.W2]|uniref:hypothetical protein n=1 Tax=Cupriavidus sp. TMH.W2 TaxID=3434465 RepID=UPI003D76C292
MEEIKGVEQRLGESDSKLAGIAAAVPVAIETEAGWLAYLPLINGKMLPVGETPHTTSQAAFFACAEMLAKRFSAVLGEWLSTTELAIVVARNRACKDPLVCHSHDFCDANMAMQQAIEEIKIGDSESLVTDEQTDLMNAAWDIAKSNHFYFEVSPQLKAGEQEAATCGATTLIKIVSPRYDDIGSAQDALAGVSAIPGYVFGYIDEKERRTITFHEDTAPNQELPSSHGMTRVHGRRPMSR